MLRDAGPDGVSRSELIFGKHFTQCGTRVDELKRLGYVVESVQREGERYVRYVLKAEPETPHRPRTYKQHEFFEGRRKTGLPLFDLDVRE